MKKRDDTYMRFVASVYEPNKEQLRLQFREELLEYHRQRDLVVEALTVLEHQMCDIRSLEVNGYNPTSRLFALPEELVGVIGTFLSGKQIRSLNHPETPVRSVRRMIHEDAQLIREYLSRHYSLS
jgi:hypothetical protein